MSNASKGRIHASSCDVCQSLCHLSMVWGTRLLCITVNPPANLRTPENRLTLVRVARNVSHVASYPDY